MTTGGSAPPVDKSPTSAQALDNALPVPGGHKVWRVGTLVYDRARLNSVFFYMLWGDFCLNLMDSAVTPTVVPLQLQKYGASMSAIGFVNGTVVEILATLMVPIISTWSDRHRGPLGRRMPFMLYASPVIALFLVLLGFSPELAEWLKRVAPGVVGGIATASLVIGVIATTMVAYRFFDLFPQSVYYYLFTDVIPQSLMGTFSCLFRVFATGASLLFNFFLLKHAENHPGAICLGAAALYLISFVMLCLMVKEGEYPPPAPVQKGPLLRRTWESVARYSKECYSLPFYWKYYLFNFCFICGFRPFNAFLIFYSKDTLKLNLGTYGNILAARDLVQIGVFFLMGPIVDKFHPLRAGLVGYLIMCAAVVSGAFFIHGTMSFAVVVIAIFASVAIFQGGSGALGPRLLPREQYGQFCSANAMVWHIGMMAAMPACGFLMDQLGKRFVFVWFLMLSAVGIVMLFLLYLDWKKLGGDQAYTPPSTR